MKNEKSAQRDANTARALAVVRFGHRPPATNKHTNTQTGPITIHCALASGAVYCNRSCLCVGDVWMGVCLWDCYHDNSKLHASILTKLGL